jgi:hypothetical protein
MYKFPYLGLNVYGQKCTLIFNTHDLLDNKTLNTLDIIITYDCWGAQPGIATHRAVFYDVFHYEGDIHFLVFVNLMLRYHSFIVQRFLYATHAIQLNIY